MWILGTAIWLIFIVGIVWILRRKEPETYGGEPLTRELEILKRTFPGEFHAIRLDFSEYSKGSRLVKWGIYTTRETGYGKTFNEAMADLKRKEGK